MVVPHQRLSMDSGLEVEPNPDDVVIDCGEFKVFVDSESAENLQGAIIDYVEDLNSSGFKIDNPNHTHLG